MRRILAGCIAVLGAAAFLFATLGSSSPSSKGQATYKIQLDNAFGLVNGSDFKVAGVIAGTITSIDLDQKTLHAVVTVQVDQKGFNAFHADAFCQSRPQSLIGEYFVDCNPGTSGKILPSGSTIPVTHTQSTIPADLVQNIMQLPYRQRFSILINELGAAVASRSEDLQTALRRADPALAETDNLLALLANDAHTIRDLNASANQVVTALARNSKQVQNFVTYADRISTESATQASNIQGTWEKLPAFLAQLRPALAKLGAAADAQDPVLANLNAASGNLDRFFTDLVPFSHESIPSLRSLGQASQTGQGAVRAATPTVSILNKFAKPTPELAQNLAIVLGALDNRGRAVERDPRAPGGKGYTGLEALLQYVFNITLAVNYYGPYGHLLGVDAFANSTCSPYATPQTIANNLASYAQTGGTNPRSCYSFLGPNQPGVTTTDPSNPKACVPDPGGAPVQGYGTHYTGPKTSACKLPSSNSAGPQPGVPAQPAIRRGASSGSSPPLTAVSTGSRTAAPPINLAQTLGQLLSSLGHAGSGSSGSGSGGSTSGAASQAQALLNYLLAP